jgi:very-short-patch-repair endonuclease
MHRSSRQSLIAERARQMRSCLTPTEQKLWAEIAGCRLGIWFRRQVPIGRYVADFVAPSVRLVVEVDGHHHHRQRAADARRNRVMERLGYRVLRLEARLVERDMAEALARIRDVLSAT